MILALPGGLEGLRAALSFGRVKLALDAVVRYEGFKERGHLLRRSAYTEVDRAIHSDSVTARSAPTAMRMMRMRRTLWRTPCNRIGKVPFNSTIIIVL